MKATPPLLQAFTSPRAVVICNGLIILCRNGERMVISSAGLWKREGQLVAIRGDLSIWSRKGRFIGHGQWLRHIDRVDTQKLILGGVAYAHV